MLMRDPLTGVFNRRYLVELEQKLRVREKSQQLLGILMIDIDRLILYNDRFGHLEGDKILQELAILLQKSSGEKNIVIRTGGGKFVVLLPETSLEKIQELGQQIREEAKLLDLEKKKKQKYGITISVGMAVGFAEPGLNVRALMRAADETIYSAKIKGGDRVEGPIKCSVDPKNNLHIFCEPVLELPNGDSFSDFYFYDGVFLPEKYGAVPLQEWESKWILEEENATLKRMLFRTIGYTRICQELQTTEIDNWREYTLLKVDNDVDVEPIYLLNMTCPSTDFIHILRVPPDINSAREAIRWVNWGIDPEEFSVQT